MESQPRRGPPGSKNAALHSAGKGLLPEAVGGVVRLPRFQLVEPILVEDVVELSDLVGLVVGLGVGGAGCG